MNSRSARFHATAGRSGGTRSPYQRDRDRVLYSSAFRRLGGVTQVVSPQERQIVHNRLTHSLKVAQFGRRLAERFLASSSDLEYLRRYLDADVVETAGLVHDLGHPPFGHTVESELDRLLCSGGSVDGFEGNAQSFRVVTKLAVREAGFSGLDLTRASLNATLKYPHLQVESGSERRKKWGAYRSETDEFQWVRSGFRDTERTLEANLMDWADDVTYAVHDLEDFYRAGLIPVRSLVDDAELRRLFVEQGQARNPSELSGSSSGLSDLVVQLLGASPLRDDFDGSPTARAGVRSFTSALIRRFDQNSSIRVSRVNARVCLDVPAEVRREVALLKELTWQFVIQRPALATQQFGQRAAIRRIFETYLGEASRGLGGAGWQPWHGLPPRYQDLLYRDDIDDKLIRRVIADFIASMTEPQLVDMHHRLTGLNLGSVFDPQSL